MLRRSRVGSSLDMMRVSEGVSRPGIDPRVWCTLGYADGDSKLDNDHGDFVRVIMMPSGESVTCRIPQSFAGDGFGEHKGKIYDTDEVVVLIPDGDQSNGGILIARLWSASDKPSDLAKNNPEDYSLVLKKDLNYWLQLQGDATQRFQFDTKVLWKFTKDGLEIGDGPTDMMALASLVKDEIKALRDTVDTFVSTYNNHTHIVTGIVTAGSPVTQSQTAPVPTQTTLSTATAPAAVGDVKSDFVKST